MVDTEIQPAPCSAAEGPRVIIREGTTAHHRAAEAVQLAAFDHIHWPFTDDLFLWVEVDGEMGAYLVWRQTAYPDEFEILSLATHPKHQRKGLARKLVQTFCDGREGDIFIEVRESNWGSRAFYKSLGFVETGRRHAYYENNREGAIVMKLRI